MNREEFYNALSQGEHPEYDYNGMRVILPEDIIKRSISVMPYQNSIREREFYRSRRRDFQGGCDHCS